MGLEVRAGECVRRGEGERRGGERPRLLWAGEPHSPMKSSH